MIDDPNDLNELRAYILRYFMLDGARQSGDLLRQPEMRRYDRYLLQRMIRAMALAGLLDRWGLTRGSLVHDLPAWLRGTRDATK